MTVHNISIIIPNYNGSEILPEVLTGLYAQQYTMGAYEVILVDDASTDHSVELVRKHFSSALIIHNHVRRGPAHAKNQGIHRARYSWLLFLDNDVTMGPHFLETLMTHALMSTAVCFQPKIVFRDSPAMLNSTGGVANWYGYGWDRGIFESDSGQYDGEQHIFFASTAAMLVRKDALEAIGNFDSSFFYLNEDFDVGMRLHMRKYTCVYIPQATCMHRMSYTMERAHYRVKYLMERNRLFMIFKNYQLRTLVSQGIFLWSAKVRKYGRYLVEARTARWIYVWALIRCWIWVLIKSPLIIYKRHAVQRMRTVPDAVVFRAMEPYRTVIPTFLKPTH